MKDARFRDERRPRCMQNSKTKQWMTNQIVMKKLIICKTIVLYNLQLFKLPYWSKLKVYFSSRFKKVTNDLVLLTIPSLNFFAPQNLLASIKFSLIF